MPSEKVDIDLNQVDLVEAVTQLLGHVKDKNALLLDASPKVILQFTFKKVPQLKQNKIIKVKLPHSLVTESSEVCLFVKDVDRNEREYTASVKHWQKLLTDHGVKVVNEIIPLKRLKLEYKDYEAQKNLANSFDIYLADEPVVRLLPALLGKHFYSCKKNPTQVNLGAKDLKKHFDAALGGTRCVLTGRGSSFGMVVGHYNMGVEQLRENITAAVNNLAAQIPGGAINVKTIQMKAHDSVSLPLYVSLGDASHVKTPKLRRVIDNPEPEDVTTVENAKVKVNRRGDVEVVYAGPDEDFDEEESENIRAAKKRKAEKKAVKSQVTPAKKKKVIGSDVKMSVTATESKKGQNISSVKKVKETGKVITKGKKTPKKEVDVKDIGDGDGNTTKTIETVKKDKMATPKSLTKVKTPKKAVQTPKSLRKTRSAK